MVQSGPAVPNKKRLVKNVMIIGIIAGAIWAMDTSHTTSVVGVSSGLVVTTALVPAILFFAI